MLLASPGARALSLQGAIMRIAMLVAFSLATGVASAQTTPPPTTPPPTKDAPNATGRTIIPEKKELGQPRGNEAPIGAPVDATAPSRRPDGTVAPATPESPTKNN